MNGNNMNEQFLKSKNTSLVQLKEQYKGRQLGELVLYHLKIQDSNQINLAVLGLKNNINPTLIETTEIFLETIISSFAKSPTFWKGDAGEALILFTSSTKSEGKKFNIEVTDDSAFDFFNLMILSLAQKAFYDIIFKNFIKKSIKKNYMKKIFIYLIIGLVLILGLKSCVVTVVSIDDYLLGEMTEDNGQINKVILTPQREMIIVKRYNDIDEIGIYKIKGIEATHYLFGLYCIGSFPFGLKYYNNADKVIDSELTLTKKIGESFPKVGETFNTHIVIFEDRVIIGNNIFKKIIQSSKEKDDLIVSIGKLKSAI